MKTIHRALLLCGVAVSSHGFAFANPFATDSLQREMILQRDYQPVGQKAEKAYFNPLSTNTSKSLKPIKFVRNTYPIAMNVTPRLFASIDNPLAPEQVNQMFHARIFGGYPRHVGANIGVLAKPNDQGSMLISVDHLSRFVNHNVNYLPINPEDRTHDTDVAIDYTHALSDRVFNVGIDAFHHANTYYGSLPKYENSKAKLTASYPLHRMVGTELRVGVSPAPLSIASGFQYSIDGKVGFTSKEDVSVLYDKNDIIVSQSVGQQGKHKVSELAIDLNGNLGYLFSGTDWGAGVDGNYKLITISALNTLGASKLSPLQLLSLDPYISYVSPSFTLRAGAKVQMLNRGDKRFLFIPDVQARYSASELFSLYINADGGAEYHMLRDIYQQNRWADAMSVYEGYDIVLYRALLGVQVGNLNGFSIDFNGGYAQYSSLSEWTSAYYVTTYADELVLDGSQKYQIHTPLYSMTSAGKAGKIFVGAKGRYISSIGLDLRVSVQYNKYISQSTKEIQNQSVNDYVVGYGRPAFEVGILADYAINDKLGVNVNFNGLGGIKLPELSYPKDNIGTENLKLGEEAVFVGDLGVRVSYKVHPNIRLSIIGENLLNQKVGRWRGYDRQGATAILAATFSF